MSSWFLRKWWRLARRKRYRRRISAGQNEPVVDPVIARELGPGLAALAVKLASEREEGTASVAFEQLVEFFGEREWHCDDIDIESRVLHSTFRSDIGALRLNARVDTRRNLFLIHGLAPVCVPEGARPAVAEAIARANRGMWFGNLEMNLDDGEVISRMSTFLMGDVLEGAVIACMVLLATRMLEHYVPAILSIIYANATPAEAIRRADADRRPVAVE